MRTRFINATPGMRGDPYTDEDERKRKAVDGMRPVYRMKGKGPCNGKVQCVKCIQGMGACVVVNVHRVSCRDVRGDKLAAGVRRQVCRVAGARVCRVARSRSR
jgi:hypothetical protein